MVAAYRCQVAQPFDAGDINAAFSLYRFYNHCRRQIHAAGGIGNHLVEIGGGINTFTQVAVIGHTGNTGQANPRNPAMMGVASGRQRAKADTVEAIGEGNNIFAALHVARDFDGRFNGIGSGRASKLNLVVEIAWFENFLIKGFKKILLGGGMKVKAMADAIAFYVFQKDLLEHWIVVTVIQCASAGQEIQVFVTFPVIHKLTLGPVKQTGE